MSHLIYRGPSALDPNVEIVGIVTYESGNGKTGRMAQLFIMRADMAPHHAQALGLDSAVCGDCPFRPVVARANGTPRCYVKTFQSCRSTWEKHESSSPALEACLTRLTLTRAKIRLGAYGDPAALPAEVIVRLAGACRGHTGYTHQWRNPAFAWLKAYCMASADNVLDMARAEAEGWRTFRVSGDDPVLADHEILCPSDIVECIRCGLCNGRKNSTDARKSIVIPAHS